MAAQFLHRKANSSLWYYRRRFPSAIAKALGKPYFVKSLKTSDRRQAEVLSRQMSVVFDEKCHAVLRCSRVESNGEAPSSLASDELGSSPDNRTVLEVLAGLPDLTRAAVGLVFEKQKASPKLWRSEVESLCSFFGAAVDGMVPSSHQRAPMENQAILRVLNAALAGDDLVGMANPVRAAVAPPAASGADLRASVSLGWPELVLQALEKYQLEVTKERCATAKRVLSQIQPVSTSCDDITAALIAYCENRRNDVKPRTIKTQLDSVVSALRLVIPELKSPRIRWLQGVMVAHVGDRDSMPVQEIKKVLDQLSQRGESKTTRKGYSGGASQFDQIAIETLALTGMRPRELVSATPAALITKTDVLGQTGIFFRVLAGKNRASERDLPLADDQRELVNIARLRDMLAWQESNPRAPAGLVTSLGVRFKKVSGCFTLYQMRHAWKDIAFHKAVDYELRERLMGHSVSGVAAAYGSGIPLGKGLDESPRNL